MTTLELLKIKSGELPRSYGAILDTKDQIRNIQANNDVLYGSGVPDLTKVSAQSITSDALTDLRFIDANVIQGRQLRSRDKKTFFDLEQRRIIVNDGENDRILIGYQLGGF